MINIKQFFLCYDLRRGCVVYAWLQMMSVVMLISKIKWLQHLIVIRELHFEMLGLQLSMIIGLEAVKGISCLPLIWGVVKKNHMFYQPWLFVNGFENAALVLLSFMSFIIGCFHPVVFYFLGPFIILAGFGWYIWFCVYTVYKKDVKPNLINFDANYENIMLNNV